MPLTLRLTKGSPLTNAEVDGNFTYLDENKLGSTDNAVSATVATNIQGGGLGYIPYQSDVDETALLAPGTAGYALISNGADAPSWQKITAGAQGGSDTNAVFFENDQTVAANYTISASKNAGSFGPITINDGVEVSIPNGSTWTIV